MPFFPNFPDRILLNYRFLRIVLNYLFSILDSLFILMPFSGKFILYAFKLERAADMV